MRRAEPGSYQKLESRIPGNSYVRFAGERSEKGWPRYYQKELLACRSNKQYLAGPLLYFLQVTDLFFRPLAGFLPHRTQIATCDLCRGNKISYRSLGCATPPRSYSLWANAKVSDS